MDTRQVVYHSQRWAEMVEQGWVTMTVDADNVANMIYCPACIR